MDAKMFLLVLFFLLAGIWLGFNLEDKSNRYTLNVSTAFKKPIDTHALGGCQGGMGIRQLIDSDLPQGPIYLTYQGRTIGIEYKLSKKELNEGKIWTALPLQGANIDHLDIVWVDGGDEIQKEPHYDLRFYTIPREEQNEVRC